jgi:hypothetical protein
MDNRIINNDFQQEKTENSLVAHKTENNGENIKATKTKGEIETVSDEKTEENLIETLKEEMGDNSQKELAVGEVTEAEEIETREIETVSDEKTEENLIETPKEEMGDNSQKELAGREVTEAEEIETREIEAVDEAITEENLAKASTEKSKNKSKNELKDREERELGEMEISDDFFDHLNRREIVETLEETVGETDIVKIKTQISLLKIRFLRLTKEEKEERLQSFLANGGNKEDFDYSLDELDLRFNEAFDRYKANKAKYMEDLEQTKIANLEKKRSLLEELKYLIDNSTGSLKQVYDRFREIQITWKEIGSVPQANIAELWENYHFYVEKFFDRVKMNRELRDLDLKKNLERKLEICEKTEALLLEKSIVRSFKLLQQYHQEWKESGPVEEDKREELWNRFKTASDKINQNRRDYYTQLDKQQNENYNAKLILCEKIEELAGIEIKSSTHVGKMNGQLAELFKAWRSIGAVPKDVEDEIWDRFRKASDTFFKNKKAFFSKRKELELDNYNMKINMCIQAEALALRKDWKKATGEVLELQKEWKQIGTMSRRQSTALWNRFRKACDSFFAAKAEFFSDIQKHETENMKKKEDLIKRVSEYVFVDSKVENFEVLKAFQREWTAIGYTAAADKERLWNTFHNAINKRFEELKISSQEINKARYTDHISEMITKNSKSGDVLEKEQRFLQNKIKQLTTDVNLWENNMGFFAHSKNSEELREQFNKKIEKAKQDIVSFKEKLAVIQERKQENKQNKEKEKSQEKRDNDNKEKKYKEKKKR